MSKATRKDDLDPHEPMGCRFIIGDPGPFSEWTYCQAPQAEGSPYCAAHHALCHRERTPQEVREMRGVLRRIGRAA